MKKKMYDVVLESLSKYEGTQVNIDSEHARSSIAASITRDVQDHIEELKQKEAKANCCDEQAKALKERIRFFED